MPIICIGDSITFGQGGTNPFPEQLGAVNAGFSGSSTADWVTEKEPGSHESPAINGAYKIMMDLVGEQRGPTHILLGGNDATGFLVSGGPATALDYFANIVSLIGRLKMDYFGPIYLSTPTPLSASYGNPSVQDRLNGFICMQNNLLEQYPGHVLRGASLHLMDPALIEEGGIHPIQAGYDWIAAELSPILLGS